MRGAHSFAHDSRRNSTLSINRIFPSRAAPAPRCPHLPSGRGKRMRVPHGDVIRFPAMLAENSCRILLQIMKTCAAVLYLTPHLGKDLIEPRCLGTRLGREIAVAGTQRQVIGCTHRFPRHNFHRIIELLHQFAHEMQLLVVFFAEHCDLRLHNIEKLQHDRCHAPEKSRAELAFQRVRHWRRFYHEFLPDGIERVLCGGKDHGCVLLRQEPAVIRQDRADTVRNLPLARIAGG